MLEIVPLQAHEGIELAKVNSSRRRVLDDGLVVGVVGTDVSLFGQVGSHGRLVVGELMHRVHHLIGTEVVSTHHLLVHSRHVARLLQVFLVSTSLEVT
jgi:hypothetical protein